MYKRQPPSRPQIPALDFQSNVLPVRELIISKALSIGDTFSFIVKSDELNAITSPVNVAVVPVIPEERSRDPLRSTLSFISTSPLEESRINLPDVVKTVLPLICTLSILASPLISTISFMMVVPPAESIVRFPDVVVTVLASSLTLSASTLVNAPVDRLAEPIAVLSILPPLISAVSATKESIFAVPSINKSCHCLSFVPKS